MVLGATLLLHGCGGSGRGDDDGPGGGDDTDATAATGGGGAGATSGGGGADRPAFGPCDGFANEVVDVTYGPGAGFGQDAMPDIVLGPPQGGGNLQGSLDVLTLGNGGSIVLSVDPQTIVDGPGPDFMVFENAFYAGGDPSAPFAEIASVSVSDDGVTWHDFPCTATELPFDGCAGWHPVYANGADNDIDPHDPALAGGEAFDLADVGLASARFVKIVDREDLDGAAGAFDLDAIALAHSTCAP
ncbi:MAG TPA: hypothetical protein VL400_11375 [Polyangiaceae bacterium]|nr:hypothetical protein [Polyangiaceae bacterium]